MDLNEEVAEQTHMRHLMIGLEGGSYLISKYERIFAFAQMEEIHFRHIYSDEEITEHVWEPPFTFDEEWCSKNLNTVPFISNTDIEVNNRMWGEGEWVKHYGCPEGLALDEPQIATTHHIRYHDASVPPHQRRIKCQ